MTRMLLVFCAWLWVANAAWAGPPAATRPGATTRGERNARLLAMRDNSWLKLAPDREPDGRDVCGCCLGDGRVFYFGGLSTGYGYSGNDVELYDLAANKWTPSWEPRTREGDFSGKEFEADAVFDAKTGRPWPAQTYQQVCYVPDKKAFFFAGHYGTWQFDPATMKWSPLAGPHSPSGKDSPHTKLTPKGYHTFYSPQLKAPVCIVTSTPTGVHVFDFAKGEWARREKDIPLMMKWYELYSTYVPSLNAHLLCQRGSPFMWLYDARDETFVELKKIPEPLEGCQAVAYDEANDVVIGMAQFKLKPDVPMSKVSVQPWVFSPKDRTWTELKPEGAGEKGTKEGSRPEGFATGGWAPLWYDPAHNVFFFLNRPTQAACETWAYRYQRR